MALSAKLVMRQGQALTLTPQLLQAIKLLQMPNAELSAFVEEELERNPLLERADEAAAPAHEAPVSNPDPAAGDDLAQDGEWPVAAPDGETGDLAQRLDTPIDNDFEPERIAAQAEQRSEDEGRGLSLNLGAHGAASSGEDAPDLEAYLSAPVSLGEYLERQAMILLASPRERMMARLIIDSLDEAGYFTGDLAELAQRIGVDAAELEALLTRLQQLEPTGVFARNLAQCLQLQLVERDRYDPAMQALVANLPLLAKGNLAALRQLCGVDDEDLAQMIAEIRRLEPKPGRAFGASPVRTAIPDVFITTAPDGAWRIELNSDALPRLLVNESFAATIKRGATREQDRSFISTNLQSANWLVKSLEQRARTILSVSAEIVRRQDSFFTQGVSGLRPLNLKAVADAVGVHESTVSRATSQKFMQTPRGLFEMKYFFTTAIASSSAAPAHSAEAVRHKIRQIVNAESPSNTLSDDQLVERLRLADIVVARRTVAKYRESLRIPSSVDRRRHKLAPQRAQNFPDDPGTRH